MKTFKITMLTALLLVGSLSVWAKNGIEFNSTGLEEALKLARKENKLVFVDVFATWCPPCKYMSKEVFPDKEVGEFFNTHFVSLKIDGETEEGRKIVEEMGVDAYPTLLFLDKNGDFVHKNVGALPKDDLIGVGKTVANGEIKSIGERVESFQQGERSKDFLVDLVNTLDGINRDSLRDLVVSAYFQQYKKLDLEDSNDFQMFLIGDNDLQSPNLKTYLANPEQYGTDLEHPLVEKFESLIAYLLDQHRSSGSDDTTELMRCVDMFLPPLVQVYGDQIPSEAELRQAVLDEI